MKANSVITALALSVASAFASVSTVKPIWAAKIGASQYVIDLFETSISWNDVYWNDRAGYLIAPPTTTSGYYDNRHTGWYATQLLARNEPGDVARAVRIFDNVISTQYTDPSKQWYGDYKHSPSEPMPGTLEYPDDGPYSSWDPNIRLFIGCAWIVALNDYGHLLPAATIEKVEKSLLLAAKGDLYRIGGVDGDNLYPCYSNPWFMRTILQQWVGNRMGDKNLTESGEKFAKEAYDLWSLHHTLSEFNSPTYNGVALWALSLWAQYAPSDSPLKTYASEIITSSWTELGQLYNANLKNVAGPWDRTYGYNMKEYASFVGALIWGAVGDTAAVPRQKFSMYHQDDYAFYPLLALAVPELMKYLPTEAKENLLTFPGEHFYTGKAYSPPFDTYPRNITTWMSENITIGAETLSEKVVGGPAKSSSAFSPAVIQWAINDYEVGCITHWVTESSIQAVAEPKSLSISYPNATSLDGPVSFNFLLSGFDVLDGFNLTGVENLPGLRLQVTTNALTNYTFVYDVSYAVNNFPFYNITYTMPQVFVESPSISFHVI